MYGGPKKELIWQFDYRDLTRQFGKAAADLQIKGAVPYQLRHAGPSWDRLHRHRSLLEVQKRGRLRSAKSLVRYERHVLVGKEFQKYSAGIQWYKQDCDEHAEEYFFGRRRIPEV